jgi:hypothetical protein
VDVELVEVEEDVVDEDVDVDELVVDDEVDEGRVVDVELVEVVVEVEDELVLVEELVLDDDDDVPIVVAGVALSSPPRRASAISAAASNTIATMSAMITPLRPRSGG